MYLPKEDLEWDPNTSEGLQRVKEYQKLILYGIQHGAQKPKSLSKLYEVRQGDKETPSAFYERLCEIARKWTDLDPEDDSNSKFYLICSAADIRKKLEKVEGEDGMTISELLSIAYKLHIPPETAWESQICLLTEKDPNEEMNISEEVLNAVTPLVWASKIPGRAKNVTPVKIELKPGAQPVRKKQHPIKLEAQKGLEPIISSFLEHGLLQECQSECNTPILPVKKPHSSEYRLGFKNSPALFGNVLAKELELWQNDHDAVTLLQYVDDLLIGSDTYEACLEATISLLNFLGLAGYRVSKKKAQIGNKKVHYMGFEITKGQRELSTERKKAICRIAVPTSKKQLRGFLGMAG
ncbi:hypothetical protein QYF61_024290 [Mycteria americana]|uniref:ribonuclease H n=1 Tax=Mycteria americana TaxID=33587 RepID=A0AAN7RL42_MYCAM|nr:hypothetical protein QYF61_024290 [Mycteria americana]